MKQLPSLLIWVLLLMATSLVSIAQTPNLINYQAVARNASGQALTNQAIAVRLSVRQSTAAGTIQYQERHAVTTNAQGLFNVQIGGGAVLSGTFANITWADAQQKHLQIELDPTGGTTYTNMGTQQLVSVPFAMYAKEAATATNDNDTNPTNEIQALSLAGNTVSLSNGGGSVNLPTYTAGIGISVAGNTITNTAPDQTVAIAGGGVTTISGAYPNFTVTTPTPADNSPTNEIQALSILGNTVSLSNGGGDIALPAEVDGSVTNEIQTLSIAGNTVSLSNGGGNVNLPTYTAGTGISLAGNAITNTAPDQTVVIAGGGVTSVSGTYPNFTVTTPTPADNSPTNEIQTLSIAGNTVSLSNGGGDITLPAEVDGSVTNEIQALSIAGNTVSLSNGGGSVALPAEVDGSVTNEIQALSIVGNTVSLSNGGGNVNLPTYTAGTGISLAGNTITNTAPDQTVAIAGGGVTSVSGTYPNFTVTTPTPADNSSTNEIQTLSIAGNTVSLSNGGGSVALPAEVDGSVTNEIQALSIAGNTVSLSNGGGDITLPAEVDGSVTNEIQALSIAGNMVSLSNGGGSVALPAEVDGSVTNEIQTLSIAGNTVSLSNGGGNVNLPTYTAGTGISLAGNAITNTAPDQTVAIAGGGVTSVNGTYPNFTVTTPTPADNSPTNEIQTLSILGNTVSLSNGGGDISLPAEVDGSVTNEIQTLSILGNTVSLSNGGGDIALPDNSGNTWNILGNSGTNPATNFIGTTDNQPLQFRVNNQPAGQISDTNAAIGTGALQNNTSGALNTAMGTSALAANSTGNENTATGSFALTSNTTGNGNTANGSNSLLNNTTGSNNTASGTSALRSNTEGYENTANGYQSLYNNTTGITNTATGTNSLFSNTTGGVNTATGRYALYNNTTGNYNTAIGSNSLLNNTTGEYNTAGGASSLFANTTGSQNTANGLNALHENSTGANNAAIGANALFNNITGNSNVAMGIGALYRNTNRSNLVAIGDSALYNNGVGAVNSEAIGNTAVGSKALYSNTKGYGNIANGSGALYSNTTGIYNTANGKDALYSNTIGSGNTANGKSALYSNTIGGTNTANGESALYFNTTGDGNTANGFRALKFNTTGGGNTANGLFALSGNTTGSINTANGYYALYLNSTGNYNIANGYTALYGNSTGSYNIGVGIDAGYYDIPTEDNQIAIGKSTGTGGANKAIIGNSSQWWIGGQVAWSAISDARIKEQVQADVPGLSFIKELRPVTYHLNIHKQKEIMDRLLGDKAKTDTMPDWEGKYDIEKIRMTGFLAQEVEAAAKKINYDFSGVDVPKVDGGLYSLRYAEFVVPLVKAVQEQQAFIETLQTEAKEVATLKVENQQIKAENQQIKARLAQIEQLLLNTK